MEAAAQNSPRRVEVDVTSLRGVNKPINTAMSPFCCSDESEYSDYSVHSGYDSDFKTTPKISEILPYQYEPMTRENIANEPNLQLCSTRGN